ncbi:MAG TPA: SpoIIE family protein phosphatase [Anaerolineales bacterium]|nr:SpoIIE family protein phosphatase [Anaerolineales bacterium]
MSVFPTVADMGLRPLPAPPPTPTSATVVLAAALVAVAAVALVLYHRRRGLTEVSLLADIGAAIATASSDTEELAEAAYVQAARLTDTDFFQFGLFLRDRYRTLIWIRDGDREPNEEFALGSSAEGLVGWVRRTGQTLVVRDFEAERQSLPAQPTYASSDPPRSAIFTPVFVGGEVLGLLAVQSRRRAAFGRSHEARLRFLAGAVAAGLENATLRAKSENRERQMALLQEVSELLVPLRPLAEVLPGVAERISRAFGGDTVSLCETTPTGFTLLASSRPEEAEAAMGLPRVQDLFQQVARQRKTAWSDAQSDASYPASSELAVPLRVQDRILGLLWISRRDGSFARIQINLAEMLAGQLAIATLEAANYAQQQEEAWFTTVLLEVARHAAQPGDWASALQAVLQLSTLLTGTAWTILFLPGDSNEELVAGPMAGLRRQARDKLTDLRIAAAELGLAPPYPAETPVPITLPETVAGLVNETRGTMTVLSVGDDLLGVWLLAGEEVQGRRLSLMSGIAHQMSLRLENTRLVEEAAVRRALERELATARAIQESFLPQQLPSPPSWTVSAAWRAARAVGGDFYDFIPLPDGPRGPRWGVAIADVADKGVPAALFMALARTLLRSVAIGRIEPGPTLSRLNDLIFHDTQAELFVSVFYAVWEPSVGRLTYANAGHCPPLFLVKDRPATLLTDHGMLVGVSEDITYRSHTLEMPPGSLLVLYTDGVTESEDSDGDFFGVPRLESLILSQQDWAAARITDAITERLAEFTGDPEPADDITIVALHRSA